MPFFLLSAKGGVLRIFVLSCRFMSCFVLSYVVLRLSSRVCAVTCVDLHHLVSSCSLSCRVVSRRVVSPFVLSFVLSCRVVPCLVLSRRVASLPTRQYDP
jgi:hypothetical protein